MLRHGGADSRQRGAIRPLSRVGELSGDLNLAEEPVRAEHRRQRGPKDLDRDVTVMLPVLGEEDMRHAPVAELALDRVVVGEGRLQPGERIGHAVPAQRGRGALSFWHCLWHCSEAPRGPAQ